MSNENENNHNLLSTSPNEDFDPLVEEGFLHHEVDGDDNEVEDNDSLCNSIGADQEPVDPYQYGVTPPVHYRAMKRAKEKSRSQKFSSKSEMREIVNEMRGSRSPNRPGRAEPARPDHIYFGGGTVGDTAAETVDSDGESDTRKSSTKKKRVSGSKGYKMTRALDRDYKQQSDSNHGNNVNNVIPRATSLKVDSPNHFKSLDSKQVVVSSVASPPMTGSLIGSLQSLCLAQQRSPTSYPVPCKERLDFLRTFNMLIRMGNRAMKDRETKAAINRQLSYEQEEWQATFSDVVWLELRAYISHRKRDEQDDLHYKLQLKVPQVLDTIMDFKVKLKDRPLYRNRSTQVFESRESVIREEENEDFSAHGSFAADMDFDGSSSASENACDNSKIVMRHRSSSLLLFDPSLSDIIQEQKKALLQVAEILDTLEKAESLYPTYKSLGQSHALYNESSFQRRLRTLFLWMNITMEMGNKLNLIARILQIMQKGSFSADWPWWEYNPKQFLSLQRKGLPTTGNPQIFVTQPSDSTTFEEEEEDDYSSEETSDDEEYDDSDEEEEDGSSEEDSHPSDDKLTIPKKNVHFDMSDSSSSAPLTPDTELPPGGKLFPNPSDTSTPSKPNPPSRSTSLISVSRTSSTVSFEETARSAIYRDYADRMLKRTGVTKLLARLKDLLEGTLQRARGALEKPKEIPTYASVTSIERSTSEAFLSTSPSMDGLQRQSIPSAQEISDAQASLTAHGAWSQEFQEMRLPSFKPTYLFLVRIPLDVIHECLRMRLEQRPKKSPSSYSIRHLIKECKEVLQAATNMKIYYQQMVNAVMTDEDSSDLDLNQFEDDLEKMLEVYMDYLGSYMSDLQENHQSAMSKQLKNFLEEEWRFAKEIIPHVRDGEGSAANRFCIMGTSLLKSISNFLEHGTHECINQLYDISATGCLEDAEAGEDGDESRDSESDAEGPDFEVRRAMSKRNSRSVDIRKGIFLTCRRFKELFNEARERVAKALNFAKMLRKDLEIAAVYKMMHNTSCMLKKLKDTGHYKVLPRHSSGSMMFIPNHIVSDTGQILHLLNITCGREDLINLDSRAPDKHKAKPDNGIVREPCVLPKPEGYLVIIPHQNKEALCWDGEILRLDVDISLALTPTEAESLLLVVLHSSQLPNQRKDFEVRVAPHVQLTNEQISCYTVIAESIHELKKEAVLLRDKVDEAVQKAEERLSLDDVADMDEAEKTSIQARYRETLLRCYNFSCEYHEELLRLVSYDMRYPLYPYLIDLAKRWMKFAINKCEKGRGRRPKWAHTGLNFLTLAINAPAMTTMSEEEFQHIKTTISTCIHHVIGDKSVQPGSSFRVSSPDVTTQRHVFNRIQSCPEPTLSTSRVPSVRTIQSEPTTPHPASMSDMYIKKSTSMVETGFDDTDPDRDVMFSLSPDTTPPKVDPLEPFKIFTKEDGDFPRLKKMREATRALEKKRYRGLREKKIVGHKTRKDKQVDLSSLGLVRPVKFRWQRTTKIGEGRFGKVYTAVNTNTAELMAMKEMKFQSNDIQYIRKIIDEIKNLENISGHPSLVQYFGVEVHSDEIYIFMEYCPGGTLAEAAKQGLTEDIIRKYTKEILVAVNVLHEHNIVHRDIKGPNIFLTEKGPLKLGDLGCAVQLKSHSTMPGEVKGMEGTAAYMAPEVFTNHEGGRSSDIWSLGCTVIEMATGKRPWPELENQFQIMYKVGMGESPGIPSHLSEEGQDFISHCLEHEPKSRWSASKLQEHSFVKIYVSDDENENS